MFHRLVAMILVLMIPAIAACSTTERASVADGSGFSALTPKRETMAHIVNTDPPFARQVLAHNKTCAAQPGCAK